MNFERRSRTSLADEIERHRERLAYARKRDDARLRSDPGRRRGRRVFMDGKACEACDGCERPAYARDPIDRRTIVCHAAYMRSYRRLRREAADK